MSPFLTQVVAGAIVTAPFLAGAYWLGYRHGYRHGRRFRVVVRQSRPFEFD